MALSFFNTTDVATDPNGKKKQKGVFQKFESGKKETEFEIKLHPSLPIENFIDGMNVNVFYKKAWKQLSMSVNSTGEHSLNAISSKMIEFEELLLNDKESVSDKPTRFLSVSFTKGLVNKMGYSQYKYDSPWIVPIKFISRQNEAYDMAAYAEMSAGMDGYSAMPQMMDIAAKTKGYRIEIGENEADFKWYGKNFQDYAGKPTDKNVVENSNIKSRS